MIEREEALLFVLLYIFGFFFFFELVLCGCKELQTRLMFMVIYYVSFYLSVNYFFFSFA